MMRAAVSVGLLVLLAGCATLQSAARSGDLEAIQAASPEEIREADESGWTPLHAAATGGQTQAVRLLIEKGADPNAGAARRQSLEATDERRTV